MLIDSHPLVSFINSRIKIFLSFLLGWQVGSSSNMLGHPASSTNSKPSDAVPAEYCKTSSSQHDTTLPLLGHSSSQQDAKSDNQETEDPQLPSSSKANVPVWLYGLVDSQLKTSHAAKPSSSNASPNLELTLAAPRPLEQNKSSPAPLLFGPITVTWTFMDINP